MVSLSPARLKRARDAYYVYNALNSFSFILLSGSFVTLYALRLGASDVLVGVLNAFAYGTFFFLPLGKRLVRDRPIVSVFGWAWAIRYLAMLPALAAPIFAAMGMYGVAFGLLIAGVAGFNIFRGIGLIGNNPVLAFLSEGGAEGRRQDKGAFIVTVQIASSLAGLGTNLLVALLIGQSASPALFAGAMGVGLAVGFGGSILLLRTPEPEDYRAERSGSLWRSAQEALREPPFRVFVVALFALAFISGMARTFLPVYAKDVFGQGDDVVMAYALVASLGTLAMGLLTRLLVDRLGAKPLFVIFTAASALSLAPLLFAAGPVGFLAGPLGVVVLLVSVNFLSSFGFTGEENAGQTYFFALFRPERTLDLGVVYFLVYGLGGSLGAGLGGVVLDLIAGTGLGSVASYRVFYGALFAALLWVLFHMRRLVRRGSATVRESLEVMLSIRDLRAFNLLARLDRSADPVEEVRLINEIGATAPRRAQEELLGYLSSPRFDVRMEALLALEKMPALQKPAAAALVAEVERHPFTTAYVAARILGKAGRREALPSLRRAVRAEDYMLQGSAMVALARLGDLESTGVIEDILGSADNPRTRISAAYALELLVSRSSVPIMISCLRRKDPPAFVSDELLLSAAAILGLMPRFYALYTAFLENEESGLALLRDAAAERFAGLSNDDPRRKAFETCFGSALERLLAEPRDGAPMSRLILSEDSPASDQAADLVLTEAALDPGLGYRGFRFFIAAYAALKP